MVWSLPISRNGLFPTSFVLKYITFDISPEKSVENHQDTPLFLNRYLFRKACPLSFLNCDDSRLRTLTNVHYFNSLPMASSQDQLCTHMNSKF